MNDGNVTCFVNRNEESWLSPNQTKVAEIAQRLGKSRSKYGNSWMRENSFQSSFYICRGLYRGTDRCNKTILNSEATCYVTIQVMSIDRNSVSVTLVDIKFVGKSRDIPNDFV